jgi:hypothetical protein
LAATLRTVCHLGRGDEEWDFFRRAWVEAAAADVGGGLGEAWCGRWSSRRTGRLRGAAAAVGGREARGVGSRVSGEEAGLVAAAAKEGDAMRGGGWGWGGNRNANEVAGEFDSLCRCRQPPQAVCVVSWWGRYSIRSATLLGSFSDPGTSPAHLKLRGTQQVPFWARRERRRGSLGRGFVTWSNERFLINKLNVGILSKKMKVPLSPVSPITRPSSRRSWRSTNPKNTTRQWAPY